MKNKFIILWLTGVVSTILALPYIFALQHDVIAQAPLSPFQLGLIAVAQTAILLAIAVFFGLKLSQSIGLQPLVLSASPLPLKEKIKHILTVAIPIGIVVGLIIKLGDAFFSSYIPQLITVAENIPFWKALLVAPYGGVVEELLTRLFLVSLFAWLFSKIFRKTEVTKNNTIMWSAIIASALLFGLGHLPATASITALTPIVITRAIILNGIGGIVFGWLYWKKGLEYSIVAHFTTDIVLHAILFALLK